MESFKSTPHSIACDAATIYSKLTNPSLIQQQIEANADRIDEQARQHLDTVKFTEDSISIQSPMGEVALSLDRENSSEDERVVYTASSSPVPINMVINLQSQDDGTTMSTAELQLQLPFFLRKMPFFLRKMVEGQLQEGAERFGELLSRIPFDRL